MKRLLVILLILSAFITMAWAADRFNADNNIFTGSHKLRAFGGTVAGHATTTMDGIPPIVISISTATTSIATTTATTLPNTNIAFPASSFTSQERVEWVVEGEIVGTNSTKAVGIQVTGGGGTQNYGTTTVTSAQAGYFILRCSLTAASSTGQLAMCGMDINSTSTPITYSLTATNNVSSTGTARLMVSLGNASDTFFASTTIMTIMRAN